MLIYSVAKLINGIFRTPRTFSSQRMRNGHSSYAFQLVALAFALASVARQSYGVPFHRVRPCHSSTSPQSLTWFCGSLLSQCWFLSQQLTLSSVSSTLRLSNASTSILFESTSSLLHGLFACSWQLASLLPLHRLDFIQQSGVHL